ncbi:hypothetical protein GCM10010269_67500 [Streptomyces humidus]|uniref:Uncharacterized protein n=1 Tax=Streptomyces humidus TaxID=52259 RepID=A0A918L813_9ACTN|nr:hypothetical protein GCM10010269_67500 [Streptomyces humidus]
MVAEGAWLQDRYSRVLSDRVGVREQAPGSHEKEMRGEGSHQEVDTTIPCRVSDNKTRWRRAPGRCGAAE